MSLEIEDAARIARMELSCACTAAGKNLNCPAHGDGMVHPRPTDDQDRVLPEHLSDRELLIELVNYMRGFTDLMTQLADQPMIGKMLGLPAGMFKR